MSIRNRTVAAATIAGLAFGLALPAFAHGPGQGPAGTGYGWGWGYGGCPGMMGQGMGPGTMMGPGGMPALPKDLSVDEVRHMLEHHLTSQGNPNLKPGKVEEKDADTIVAEIVTTNGSLVQRFQVNRHTGWTQPAQ